MSNQKRIQDRLIALGFLESVAKKIVTADQILYTESMAIEWGRMREVMRKEGWNEVEIQTEIERLSSMIDLVFDELVDKDNPAS